MAPRNNDANTSYKKKNFPVEDTEVDVKDIVPCLLHKKHKVVKLVKSQLQKIQEEGLLCGTSGADAEEFISEEESNMPGNRRITRDTGRAGTSKNSRQSAGQRPGEEMDLTSESDVRGNICMCAYFLAFLLSVFLLMFLMVWVSAGPLSNTVAHSPISGNCFIRTDSLCTLEKKYLLRWSKPQYFE